MIARAVVMRRIGPPEVLQPSRALLPVIERGPRCRGWKVVVPSAMADTRST